MSGCNIANHEQRMIEMANTLLKEERLVIPESGTIFSWNALGELKAADYDYIVDFFNLRKKHFSGKKSQTEKPIPPTAHHNKGER